MALTDYPSRLSLTTKDYESLISEILAKVPVLTEGKWSNLNRSDPGIALLELLASMINNLYYYQDVITTELYIPSANQRLSLMKLLRVYGYEISTVKAARGNVTASVNKQSTDIIYYPIEFNKYNNVQFSAKTTSGVAIYTMLTPEEVSGTALAEYRISSLTEKVILPVIQGILVETSKTVFVSDGTQNQRFIIDQTYVDISQLTLKVNDRIWTRVNSFFGSTGTSETYRVEYNDQLKPVIIFGDNQFGAIPPYGSVINVRCYTTNGYSGNVGVGAVDSVLTTITDVTNQKTVGILVTNTEPIVGGADIEKLESAKENAVGRLTTNNRLVTAEDFGVFLRGVPGVDKILAWGEQEEAYPNYAMMNRVQICFFSETGWDFNNINHVNQYNAVKQRLTDEIQPRIPITTRFTFVKPRIVDLYLSLHLGIDTRNYDPQLVTSQVRTALKNYFAIENVSFGEIVYISTISQVCNSIPGVLWSQVTRLHTLPIPTYVLDAGPPTIVYPDPADAQPKDMYLKKNELPSLTERSYIINPPLQVPQPPYIKIDNFPSIYDFNVINTTTVPDKISLGKVGVFNLKIVNPDGQQDVLAQGVRILPPSETEHITITYTDSARNQQTNVGYLNKPAGDSAVYCPKV
jgi:hypothetical protein